FSSGVHLADAVRFAISVPVGPPLAVRAFLVESRHLSVPTLLYGMILGLALPLLALQVVTAGEPGPRLVAAGFIVWLLFLPAALRARGRPGHRTDLRRERRVRLWGGPLGRWLFQPSGRPAPLAAAPPPPAAGLPSYRTRTAPDSAPVQGG